MAQVTPAQIAMWARQRGLDPNAVLAVASKEGLGGGIGDSGTSFGPFQLHYGGAYPDFAPQGAAASQAWAWSPSGVNYALDKIQGVAAGLTGAPAITNIVSRFERPADIPGEISGALANYGAPLPAAPTVAMPAVAPTAAALAPAAAPAPAAPVRTVASAKPRPLPAAVMAALDILRS